MFVWWWRESSLTKNKPRLNRRKFADYAADCSDDDDEDDDEEDEYDLDDDFASENEEQDGKKTQTTEVLLFEFVNYFIDYNNTDEDDAEAASELNGSSGVAEADRCTPLLLAAIANQWMVSWTVKR